MAVMSFRSALAALSLSLVAASGCKAQTDLNSECILVKKDPSDPTGKKSVAITAGELRANANRDVISFGATQCEDLVCVREAGAPLPAADAEPVSGRCSRSCAGAGDEATCKSFDESLDKNPDTALVCRPLLLDASLLASLRQADEAAYRRYFGDNSSPYFCAREPAAP
jgi:hypothetical protein